LRLVGGRHEGQWVDVENPHLRPPVSLRPGPPRRHITDPIPETEPAIRTVNLIPTGSVEWDGDRCAEVWVPEDRLDLWRAEHDVERL
jgi:hypothetical protein